MLPVPLLFERGWETGIKQRWDKSYSCRFPSSAKRGTDWKAPKKACTLETPSLIRRLLDPYPQGRGTLRVRPGIALWSGISVLPLPARAEARKRKGGGFFSRKALRPPSPRPGLVRSAAKVQEPGSRANEICVGYKSPADVAVLSLI